MTMSKRTTAKRISKTYLGVKGFESLGFDLREFEGLPLREEMLLLEGRVRDQQSTGGTVAKRTDRPLESRRSLW